VTCWTNGWMIWIEKGLWESLWMSLWDDCVAATSEAADCPTERS
jgi:hypothetical protein